jgi:hypothetical protein
VSDVPLPEPPAGAPADPSGPDAEVLARRVAGLAPRCGRTVVVGVDGPSGSGKSTLADALADRLRSAGRDAAVVRLDDTYPGWDGLDAAVPRVVDGVLAAVAAGRPGTLPRWDWAAGREGPPDPVPVPDVLVLEGVGAGARACAPYLSLLVWLDGPADVRRRRALCRDGDGYAPHWERWAAQERVHFAREGTAGRADATYCVGSSQDAD